MPDEINVGFLKKFKQLIEKFSRENYQFLIITGGGKTSRRYSSAAKALGELNHGDLDWLGIHATRLNAHLVRTILSKLARPRIITNPNNVEELKNHHHKVIVAAGYQPGWSTDYVAVLLAREYGIKKILNLSNIDYVYDKDPKKHQRAKKIEQISWKDFRKIVGHKWDPGLNMPFDPVAAKLAEKLGLQVVIMNGQNFKNLENFLSAKKFKGTLIAD